LTESVYRIYAELEWKFGSGESAIMALAQVEQHVVASSNIKDVKDYCNSNNIDWITTMDLLAEAYNRRYLVNMEAIAQMLAWSRSRIKLELTPPAGDPEDTIVSIDRAGDFKKWMNR